MTSMPVFDDRKVDLFRRTGKRRASSRSNRGSVTGRSANVVLQGDIFCPVVGERCRHPNGALGFCHPGHICMQDPLPGHSLPPPHR
jgi:hypothetical protein